MEKEVLMTDSGMLLLVISLIGLAILFLKKQAALSDAAIKDGFVSDRS